MSVRLYQVWDFLTARPVSYHVSKDEARAAAAQLNLEDDPMKQKMLPRYQAGEAND